MPVFARYDLDDLGTVAADSALGNGAQDGSYINGAQSEGGRAELDGVNDLVKFGHDPAFQMARGTLEIQFSQTAHVGDGPNTILSRDSVGETAGGFRIEVLNDGSILVTHETPDGAETWQTDAGFLAPGDEVNLSYSWNEDGPGALVVENLTQSTDYTADVPAGLTMDQGDINQKWMIGAGQSSSDPWLLNNLDSHFNGSVEYFQLSDTVDNLDGDPVAQPDTAVTDEDTLVTVPVLDNDSDPQGQTLTVTGASAENGQVVVNDDGTLDYTPNENYHGPDRITYTVTDPDGNTATSHVTVTVNPVNDDPDANPDSATTAAGTAVTIPVLANDADVDGDTLSIVGTPTAANGTVGVNSDGTLTYTPNAGFVGTETFTYTVSDGNGGTAEATVTVTVTEPDPVRDGIVHGTPGGDLIDTTYTDTDGDVVDGEDAIIPGDAPNDDRIYGHDGDDTIRSGEGNDTVYGGRGDDDINTDSGLPAPDRGYPGLYPGDTDPHDDHDTVYGGAGNDTIRTGDDADVIYGGSGDDSLDGGVDDDLIYGNTGNDTIIGGEGSDTIIAGQGDDLVYGGLGPDFPDAVNIRDDRGDLVIDNGRDVIATGWGNDTVYGQDDDDTIMGGMGDDLLDGGIDDDLIYGGWGDDTLIGGQGDDTLYGQMGDDLIEGGTGNDLIYGGQGNDTIIGGPGADSMYGGGDRDVFIISRPEHGRSDHIDGNEGGDDFDTLDLTGAGPLRIDYDPSNPENGTVHFLDGDGNETGTLVFRNIENVVPCFTPGTLIATPRGEVPVEELRAGDKVVTRDNGIREIAWTGAKHLDWPALCANPHLKPVLIRQGSLGNGLPERDMLVSPNHRMLVANDRTALYFEDHEVLVAAKHLIGGKGVRPIDAMGVTYIHFMFERHEVVLANGAWTESFQPGDWTLKGMGNAQRQEILELFPELATEGGLADYQAARRTLKKHEAALLVR